MKKLAGFAFLSLFVHSAVLASASMAGADAPGGVDSSSPYFAIGTAVTIPTKEELKAQKRQAQQQAKAQKLARKQAAKNDRRSGGYLPILGGLGLALVLAGAAAGGGGGGSGGGGSDSR